MVTFRIISRSTIRIGYRMNRSITVNPHKTEPLSVVEITENDFTVIPSNTTETNGYLRNSNTYSQIYLSVLFNTNIRQELFDRAFVEVDVLDDGDIVFDGFPTPASKQQPVMSVNMNNEGSISRWNFVVRTRVQVGIKIKRLWFTVKQSETPLGESIIVPRPSILIGNGYKHHDKPGVPYPYIAGQVKHRGQPTQSTITMSTPSNPEHIIVTDAIGRYFYQTTSNRMQLTANSNWSQHNDIVRREVYPNTDIGLPGFVGVFDYLRQTNILLEFLPELVVKDNFWQFPQTLDNQTSTATVTNLKPNELLCLDWSMESEPNYDKFNGNGWSTSGTVAGTLALTNGQSISYSKNSSGAHGFDNVRFASFKLVDKTDTMATISGYLDYRGTIMNPDLQNMTTDFVDVAGKQSVTYEVYPTNPTDSWIGWCFYDTNKQVIGYRQVVTDFKKTISVPSNAKYIRIGARYLQGGYLKIA